jgi:hypothetical protein
MVIIPPTNDPYYDLTCNLRSVSRVFFRVSRANSRVPHPSRFCLGGGFSFRAGFSYSNEPQIPRLGLKSSLGMTNQEGRGTRR